MTTWRDRTLAATFILLAASVSLLIPGLAGIGASGPVFAVLFAGAALLAALRPQIAELPPFVGYDVSTYLRDIWVGPVIAVLLVVLIEPNASAAEVQAIGGIAGFFGMVNYFVRPLYFLGYGLLRRVLPLERSG